MRRGSGGVRSVHHSGGEADQRREAAGGHDDGDEHAHAPELMRLAAALAPDGLDVRLLPHLHLDDLDALDRLADDVDRLVRTRLVCRLGVLGAQAELGCHEEQAEHDPHADERHGAAYVEQHADAEEEHRDAEGQQREDLGHLAAAHLETRGRVGWAPAIRTPNGFSL